MMIEKSGSIELRDISIAEELTPEMKEMAAGMVRVKHLYRSALKIAVTQMEILDEEFASLYDHSPIHHIEHRIKTLESAAKKLKRRGYDLTIDNIYAHIQDMAGVRVICNYLDDIYYLRGLLTRTESFRVIREADYIKEPKETGYRSLHLIVEVPIVISEGTLKLPVFQTFIFDIDIIVIGNRINAYHFNVLYIVEKTLYEIAADKAGGTCYKNGLALKVYIML